MKDIIRMNQLAGLITEGQALKMMAVLNESMTAEDFGKFNEYIKNNTPLKIEIELHSNQSSKGIIMVKDLKKVKSFEYEGFLIDNGGLKEIEILKNQKIKLSNFPNSSEHNSIGNITGKEELNTSVGKSDSIIFTFLNFVW